MGNRASIPNRGERELLNGTQQLWLTSYVEDLEPEAGSNKFPLAKLFSDDAVVKAMVSHDGAMKSSINKWVNSQSKVLDESMDILYQLLAREKLETQEREYRLAEIESCMRLVTMERSRVERDAEGAEATKALDVQLAELAAARDSILSTIERI